MQPPNGALPAAFAKRGLKFAGFIWRGNGDNGGPESSVARLAKIAGGKQALGEPVAMIEQQNVDVAVKLAVLETVVEQVNLGQVRESNSGGASRLGEQAGFDSAGLPRKPAHRLRARSRAARRRNSSAVPSRVNAGGALAARRP